MALSQDDYLKPPVMKSKSVSVSFFINLILVSSIFIIILCYMCFCVSYLNFVSLKHET